MSSPWAMIVMEVVKKGAAIAESVSAFRAVQKQLDDERALLDRQIEDISQKSELRSRLRTADLDAGLGIVAVAAGTAGVSGTSVTKSQLTLVARTGIEENEDVRALRTQLTDVRLRKNSLRDAESRARTNAILAGSGYAAGGAASIADTVDASRAPTLAKNNS